MTLKRITLWAVLHRALKNATSSRKGDWGHAIRVMLVLAGMGYGGFGLYHGTPDRGDFNSAYPSYEQLESATGMLVQGRNRRFSYYLFEPTEKPYIPVFRNGRLMTDKPVLYVEDDYTLSQPFEEWGWYGKWAGYGDDNYNLIPHFVTIKYFRMQSGAIWIAELSNRGHLLLDYEHREKGFALRKQDQYELDRSSAIVLLLAVLALTWIVFEAYAQLKRENQDGNE